ncbi:MAG: NAD(P)H-dependent dehydrogenase/reductase [Desulfobulbus propionicus]|nr:MAG: NAD(P)H-dependent dehydrogenase/reductase [Desulfobulbus propionicus]
MLIELLRKRRSIRTFTAQPVEQEKIDLLIEAALRAPSSRSLHPLEFVLVRDAASISALAAAKTHGSAFMQHAPVALVICADATVSDVWVEDASIAALLVHLEAADLGLGSCWVQIRKRPHDNDLSAEAYVAKLLGLRQDLRVEAIVAVGYPGNEPPGHSPDSLLRERVSVFPLQED